MTSDRSYRRARPLDLVSLNQLALCYVGRYATSSGKLASYLDRKIRELGWHDDSAPPVSQIIDRMTERGFVDDRAYAEMKTNNMLSRGYGPARIRMAIRTAGIVDHDDNIDDDRAWKAAESYARRRKLGPFALVSADRAGLARAYGAMIRAGHSFDVTRRLFSADSEALTDDAVD
jgi:regulatory protein